MARASRGDRLDCALPSSLARRRGNEDPRSRQLGCRLLGRLVGRRCRAGATLGAARARTCRASFAHGARSRERGGHSTRQHRSLCRDHGPGRLHGRAHRPRSTARPGTCRRASDARRHQLRSPRPCDGKGGARRPEPSRRHRQQARRALRASLRREPRGRKRGHGLGSGAIAERHSARPLLLAGDGAVRVIAALRARGCDVREAASAAFIDAAVVARMAAARASEASAEPPAPFYLRPPSVTTPAAAVP